MIYLLLLGTILSIIGNIALTKEIVSLKVYINHLGYIECGNEELLADIKNRDHIILNLKNKIARLEQTKC